MIAMAMTALLLAAAPAQEVIENLEEREVEVVLYEDSENEELAMNEECEQIVFEDENEVSEGLVTCEDEE